MILGILGYLTHPSVRQQPLTEWFCHPGENCCLRTKKLQAQIQTPQVQKRGERGTIMAPIAKTAILLIGGGLGSVFFLPLLCI